MAVLVFTLLVLRVLAQNDIEEGIGEDSSCTVTNEGGYEVYSQRAVGCANMLDDDDCKEFYGGGTELGAIEGNNNTRPEKCYKDPSTGTGSNVTRNRAIKNCAKYCGFCCLTSAYNCVDNPIPATDCSKITQEDCKDPLAKTSLIENCPGVCGFCDLNDCVDRSDLCQEQGILFCLTNQEFTSVNCRRMCQLCSPFGTDQPPAVSTNSTASTVPSGTCKDNSLDCAKWNHNGFCNSTFYSPEVKEEYCAKTCSKCLAK